MKYKVEGTVTFAWETEIEADSVDEARDLAEEEALDGQHLDHGASDLGKTTVTALEETK